MVHSSQCGQAALAARICSQGSGGPCGQNAGCGDKDLKAACPGALVQWHTRPAVAM